MVSQPIESRQSAARGVDCRRCDDDQGVRGVENALHGRMSQTGPAVGEDDVVEAVEDPRARRDSRPPRTLPKPRDHARRPRSPSRLDSATYAAGRRSSERSHRRPGDRAPSSGSGSAPAGLASRSRDWRRRRSLGRPAATRRWRPIRRRRGLSDTALEGQHCNAVGPSALVC